jgi:starch-binding outer membrane protein, SusD/RagB family
MLLKRILLCIAGMIILDGCTKLDERFLGDTTQSAIASNSGNTATLLGSLYNNLEAVFTHYLYVFPLQELCTDEAIAPTRGTDWDDNGMWRVLHQQKWVSSNPVISDGFNKLNGLVFASTEFLRFNPTIQQQAEARFIRAWAMYLELDLFDQVPYRDTAESVIQPSRVRQGIEALNYIISELDSIQNDLPNSPASRANKDADRLLLMKCYLNKAVYENRSASAFNFDPADMNKVISLADDIIQSSRNYQLALNYFDNFAPDNTLSGRENIFTLLNEPGSTPKNETFFAWIIPLHYNQAPSTNGWTTLSKFYDKFEPNEKRRGMVYTTPNAPPNPANEINVGFLAGQQYDYTSGDPLGDGSGAPLIFTPEVHLIETGSNYRSTGIRPIKYFPDWGPNYFSPDNDFVFYRFSDVLLMKAEAIARGGTGTNVGSYGNTELSIVNALRTHPSRAASALSSVSLNDIYDERGRELWWEGWRREDMIRFKMFLLPFQEKEYDSDPKYLIYPIPDDQLAVNPNLHQNTGY